MGSYEDPDHYIVKDVKDIIVGEIPRHRAYDLQGPRVRSAEDPGHYLTSLPGRLVAQQGQGQAYRGTRRGHVSGVNP